MRSSTFRNQLTLAVALPTLGCVGLVLLLAVNLGRGEAQLDRALAWQEHALAIRATQSAARAALIDLQEVAEGLPPAQAGLDASLAELERASQEVLRLAAATGGEAAERDRRLADLTATMVAGARTVAGQAEAQRLGEARAQLVRLEGPRQALLSLLRELVDEATAGTRAAREAAQAAGRRQLLIGLAVTLAALLLAIIPAHLLYARLRGDVLLLEAAASRVAHGDLSPVGAPLAGGLADLVQAFDRMAEELRHRQRLEAQVHGAQRLAELGTLSVGLAHEINNPLAFVTSNLTVARRELARLAPPAGTPADAGQPRLELVEAIDEALAGCRRMASIVHDLKLLARADPGELRPVDLAPVVEAALHVARVSIPRDLDVRFEHHLADLPLVVGAEARLGQVFLNLLVNAVHAVEATGRGAGRVTLTARADGTDLVLVELTDDGVGMTPEVRARLFQPFFTTRASRGGTGLGLSVCQGIVAGLGGTLAVESRPGHGTTFRIALRRVTEPADPAAPSRAVDGQSGGVVHGNA